MILNDRLSLYPVESSKDKRQKQKMVEFFPHVPNDYFEYVNRTNGLNLLIDNSFLLEIWPPDRSIDSFENYQFNKYLPEAIPIGGDGGDSVILYLDNKVYVGDVADLDINSILFLANSLTDFLCTGVGFQKLIKF